MEDPTCVECLKPCELHGETYCGTCHKHEGECNMGDCEEPIEEPRWEFRRENGTVYEVRGFCHKHSTHPYYGWLRKGGVRQTK